MHAAFFVVISAWHPTPIFRRVAPVPMPVHSSCTLLGRLAMPTLELSEKACSLLRDFMLVFDLGEFFKGSTEVTDSDAAKTLEYIKSVFEQANLPAPTTYMTPIGLLKHLKLLRNTNQKFKNFEGARCNARAHQVRVRPLPYRHHRRPPTGDHQGEGEAGET